MCRGLDTLCRMLTPTIFANFNHFWLSNWTSHLSWPTKCPSYQGLVKKGVYVPLILLYSTYQELLKSNNFMASKNYLWNNDSFWNFVHGNMGNFWSKKHCQLQLQTSKARFCKTHLSRLLIQALRHSRHIACFSSSHQIRLYSSSPQTAQSSIWILRRKCDEILKVKVFW